MQSNSSELDIKAILKVSQTLFSEITLKKLFKKIINIVIKKFGSQIGFLILKSGDELLIEGEFNFD